MGFLKSLGLVTSEEPAPKKDKAAPLPIKTTQITNVSTPINLNSSTQYSKLLEEAINKRDLPGPDFLEFYKTLKNVDSQPLPDQQKYILAFSGLSSMGLTKEKSLTTSKIYLDALEQEEKDFKAVTGQINQKEVVDKMAEIEKLSNENISLQKKIQENIETVGKLNTEVSLSKQKIATNTQQFSAAIETERNNIAKILTNIQNYL